MNAYLWVILLSCITLNIIPFEYVDPILSQRLYCQVSAISMICMGVGVWKEHTDVYLLGMLLFISSLTPILPFPNPVNLVPLIKWSIM